MISQPRLFLFALLTLCASGLTTTHAAVLTYGDLDVLGVGSYSVDPTTGATLEGLAPDAVTLGAPPVAHGYPFAPEGDDYPGTDQIYAGSVQTGAQDGYSTAPRVNGPQVFVLDYSSLIPAGQTIASLTLGIAADDFQFPSYAQPFSAAVNGSDHPALTSTLNSIDLGGPVVRFFTIGISPAALVPSHLLTVSIDNRGDGGDGWAVDFLTVGVTTVPEPAALLLLGSALSLGLLGRWRR